ncbi:MAG: RNA polymerase sigma factor [Actinomycetota bacterium]
MGPSGHDNGAERRAFEAIYADHASAVAAYALRRARSEDVGDVVAETFIVVWRRLAEVPGEPETRPWVLGVARRALANQRRGRNRRTELGRKLQGLVPVAVGDPAELVSGGELDPVLRAIEQLSETDRELLRLVAWEQLSPTEIALVMGLSAVTVRKRLHRARERLRQAIERQQPRPVRRRAPALADHPPWFLETGPR